MFILMTVLLNGMFPKERLLDLIRNFIVFQNINGKTVLVADDSDVVIGLAKDLLKDTYNIII